MADFATNGYTAALFDLEGTISIGKKPTIKIFTGGNIDAIEFLEDNWGGQLEMGGEFLPIPYWTLVGWDAVLEFSSEVRHYSIMGKRLLDVLENYSLYALENGFIEEAMDAANTQISALTSIVCPAAVTWDIETMGLTPDDKPFLTCSFQRGDEEDDVWNVDVISSGDEHRALVFVRQFLEAAPYTIAFNSLRFDIPYVNTRLAKYGERPMMLGSHDDCSVMYDKKMGRSKRTSLKNAVDEQGLADDEKHKTPIDWVKWNAANEGNQEAMDYVLEHSDNDVVLTRRLYNVTIS